MLKKRSFAIARHRTSVALENEFWLALEAEARRERLSMAALIGRIDAERGGRSLASALRLRALASVSRQP